MHRRRKTYACYLWDTTLALLRGHGLSVDATNLLTALSLFKVRRFLSTGLRLRTACDLEAVGDLAVTRPNEFVVPEESALLNECKRLIVRCKSLFANPAVTEVEWKPGKKKDKEKTGGSEQEAARENDRDQEENAE